MYNFRTPNRSEWQTALDLFPEANLLQSWQWGEVAEGLGHTTIRYIISDKDILGAMSCIVKDAKRGRYLEVPAGPLIDWTNQQLVDAVVAKLRAIAREHRCVFVRMRPQLEDTPEHHVLMQRLGAKPALMHVAADHTTIVDVSVDEETLLAQMRQQTRYEVRRAKKRSVIVDQIDPLSHIEQFHELQVQTASRQNFYPPSLLFLSTLCEKFGKNIRLYQATKDGILLNLALVIYFGREIAYFEAASTVDARRESGAYAIIWQMMLDAKDEGYQYVNLWGTAPADSPNHRYAGVTTFKRGFGGQDATYLSAHDLVIQPLRYALTRSIESVRKKRRRL